MIVLINKQVVLTVFCRLIILEWYCINNTFFRDHGTFINPEPDDFSPFLYPVDSASLQNDGSLSPQHAVTSIVGNAQH